MSGTTHLTIDMYHNHDLKTSAESTTSANWSGSWTATFRPTARRPPPSTRKSQVDFAREHGITFYEGEGVCHQVMMEKHVRPGRTHLRSGQSHLRLRRARRISEPASGCTDYLYAMVTGASWLLSPGNPALSTLIRKASGRRLRPRPDPHHHRKDRRQRSQLQSHGIYRRRACISLTMSDRICHLQPLRGSRGQNRTDGSRR